MHHAAMCSISDVQTVRILIAIITWLPQNMILKKYYIHPFRVFFRPLIFSCYSSLKSLKRSVVCQTDLRYLSMYLSYVFNCVRDSYSIIMCGYVQHAYLCMCGYVHHAYLCMFVFNPLPMWLKEILTQSTRTVKHCSCASLFSFPALLLL